jgi:hypothetical protein
MSDEIDDFEPEETEAQLRFNAEMLAEESRAAGHVLLNPATCPCDKQSDTPCPVCDHGFAICAKCGWAGEGLLVSNGPCPGKLAPLPPG